MPTEQLGRPVYWHTLNGEGTEVTITVPLQFLHEKEVTAAIPSV